MARGTAEQGFAADWEQPTLVPRFGYSQRLKPSVRPLQTPCTNRNSKTANLRTGTPRHTGQDSKPRQAPKDSRAKTIHSRQQGQDNTPQDTQSQTHRARQAPTPPTPRTHHAGSVADCTGREGYRTRRRSRGLRSLAKITCPMCYLRSLQYRAHLTNGG